MVAIRVAGIGVVVAIGLILTVWQVATSSGRTTAPAPFGHSVQYEAY